MPSHDQNRLSRHIKLALSHTKVRFILVGISNTAIDFLFLNILLLLGSGLVEANIVSTTIAMAASYLLNKQVVFQSKRPHSMWQVVLFLAVTLTGIWVIQSIVLAQVFNFLEREFVSNGPPVVVWLFQNIAKAVAVAVGALWNYFGYSRLVFKPGSNSK